MSNGDYVAYEEGYPDVGLDAWSTYGDQVLYYQTADPQPVAYEANYPEPAPSADIYTTPPVSLSDAVRSGYGRDPYTTATTPTDSSGFGSFFRSVLSAGVTLGGAALKAFTGNTVARAIPGVPAYGSTPGGASGLPSFPFPLPSFLGGGTSRGGVTGGGGSVAGIPMQWILLAAVGLLAFFMLSRAK